MVGGPAGPDPYDVCLTLDRRVTPGTRLWADYGLNYTAVGYSPVEVPRWLRVKLVQNDLIFTVLGAIGAVLVLAQGGYGLKYYMATKGDFRATTNKTPDARAPDA